LGWLLLGPSDPLLGIVSSCEIFPTPHGVLYPRRRGQGCAPRAAAQSLPAAEVATPRLPGTDGSSRHEPTSVAPSPSPAASVDTEPSADDALNSVLAIAHDHGFAAAETACRDELRAHPLSAPLYLAHGKLLLELGREVEAEIALRRALYLDRALLI